MAKDGKISSSTVGAVTGITAGVVGLAWLGPPGAFAGTIVGQVTAWLDNRGGRYWRKLTIWWRSRQSSKLTKQWLHNALTECERKMSQGVELQRHLNEETGEIEEYTLIPLRGSSFTVFCIREKESNRVRAALAVNNQDRKPSYRWSKRYIMPERYDENPKQRRNFVIEAGRFIEMVGLDHQDLTELKQPEQCGHAKARKGSTVGHFIYYLQEHTFKERPVRLLHDREELATTIWQLMAGKNQPQVSLVTVKLDSGLGTTTVSFGRDSVNVGDLKMTLGQGKPETESLLAETLPKGWKQLNKDKKASMIRNTETWVWIKRTLDRALMTHAMVGQSIHVGLGSPREGLNDEK